MSLATDFEQALGWRSDNGPAVAALDTVVFDTPTQLNGVNQFARFFIAATAGTVNLILADGSPFTHTVTVIGRQDFSIRQFNSGGTILVGDLTAFI